MTSVDQVVDDLIWAINSPSLISNVFLDSAHERESHGVVQLLDSDDISFEHLGEFMESVRDRRVGRYFERLILYWLVHVRQVEMVAHGLQVRDGKQTLGEIDFLFTDERRLLNHWEVAIKFYLYDPGHLRNGSHHLGPNASDNFEAKTQRMFEHQLLQSQRDFPEVAIRRAFVKGRIFYPMEMVEKPTTPANLAANHLTGWWIRDSELARLQRPNCMYRIREKPHWLDGAHACEGSLQMPEEFVRQLSEHFDSEGYPVYVSQFQLTDEGMRESSCGFVVPDEWPNN
ncbi:MAG: DUF1853 family protein [Mariniblastus sp.]|nr:DUF1853 family protein [Mariniblastus sp.]